MAGRPNKSLYSSQNGAAQALSSTLSAWIDLLQPLPRRMGGKHGLIDDASAARNWTLFAGNDAGHGIRKTAVRTARLREYPAIEVPIQTGR